MPFNSLLILIYCLSMSTICEKCCAYRWWQSQDLILKDIIYIRMYVYALESAHTHTHIYILLEIDMKHIKSFLCILSDILI